MDLFKSFNDQLDDLLRRICVMLEITPTQRDEVERHYNAVSAWLAADESLFDGADIQIYPQGSLRLGTTVKPLSGQEFDLDLVCEIQKVWRSDMNPLTTLNTIEKRLREHGTYAPMVERMNRCIRLNYAGEFHMDILPAYPIGPHKQGFLKVPDRELKGWKDSNPRGYADWFEDRCKQVSLVFDKKAEAEPLPSPEIPDVKPPLKRAVQLMKRYRDVYFGDEPEKLGPISIVLSTLAARNYDGQGSVTDTISFVLSGILREIEEAKYLGSRVYVCNPSNPREDLSEKWDSHPERYEAFVQFIQDFQKEWESVVRIRGLANLAAALSRMFGEKVTREALKGQADFVEKLRKSVQLGIFNETGVLSLDLGATNVTPIKRNTFYGEE
ncbi:MAG TPA: nucleotidyltransferase [Alicyclobacillus sp.]|nr:nucleotidyltransferase [Alicyclobacillus sp.]